MVENTNMNKHVGKIILDRLRVLKQTQTWLAESIGVSNNAVTKWINCGKISRANAVKVADTLNVSTDELLAVGVSSPRDQILTPLALIYVDENEVRLITQYREASDEGKVKIECAAQSAT